MGVDQKVLDLNRQNNSSPTSHLSSARLVFFSMLVPVRLAINYEKISYASLWLKGLTWVFDSLV